VTFAFEEVAKDFCSTHSLSYEGPVGQGAFKETFRTSNVAGQLIALKVFKPGFSPERTQREVEAMLKCTHPNIARLMGIEPHAHGGMTYIVAAEEYLAGGSLSDRLKDGNVLSVEQTTALGSLLIDAVAHVAQHRLVHRDLKGDNIMFRDKGMSPVIVDFGLVRDLTQGSLTATWALRGPGTPLFAPPEQLLNEKALIDWRADQFSLGVLLSFAAFGFHPYSESGDDWPAVVERVALRQNASQQFMLAATATSLQSLIKMVAPYPVERYRTPQDLAAAWPRGTK
jgi:eukaryotic-like serine/threonine-protein kinase